MVVASRNQCKFSAFLTELSGGSRGPPCPFFKIMQFSGNFKGRTPILSTFWDQGPPIGVKTLLGPPMTKILDPRLERRPAMGTSIHGWCPQWLLVLVALHIKERRTTRCPKGRVCVLGDLGFSFCQRINPIV